jgi:hypothetical protein
MVTGQCGSNPAEGGLTNDQEQAGVEGRGSRLRLDKRGAAVVIVSSDKGQRHVELLQ